MNIYAKLLQIPWPGFIKKIVIKELFLPTADAFKAVAPSLKGLSFPDCLSRYALFTRQEVEKAARDGGDLEQIKAELFERAYRLGYEVRQRLEVRSNEEVMAVGKFFYNILGIEFQGDASGNITIPRCFFSDFYSSRVCQVISALDDGILAGLSGGGRLNFIRRITEGGNCCMARMSLSGNGP